ncbi:MAG TPA: WxcM-like domain-containing protein [Rhizomicrobium sp.]|nr:WxcM-like domain-containing protein [Rhizomicrobium sp.]
MSTAAAAVSTYYKHPEALVESAEIGPRTRIWAFAHILAGARIGADCNICDHTLVEGGVRIGDRVTVKPGVQLWEGVTLEDDVFIGPNATFTNDRFPRSRQRPAKFARTRVERGASIGANATVLPGLVIGERAMIGAGAVVTRDIPGCAIVAGNPARVRGFVDQGIRPVPAKEDSAKAEMLPGGSALHRMPRISDARGHLTFGERNRPLPFEVVRYFLVFGVPSREIRGEHAHRTLHQFLVCAHGSCSVALYDGRSRGEVTLDRPHLGLHVPPMVWTTQYRYSPDAVLLVLASDVYREQDYIRDLGQYQELVQYQELGQYQELVDGTVS